MKTLFYNKFMNKNEKRKIMKEKQKKLTQDYCYFADNTICNHILSLREFQNADTVFCFINTANEINTRPIIEHAWAMKKNVVVPRCTGKGVMEAFKINSYDDLESGKYGIPEPKRFCPFVSSSEIDFGVIPCISCCLDGWRLGHGGGYYDRYLENTDFTTAVICRHRLLSDDICHEIHDKRMDIVVTEEIIKYISRSVCTLPPVFGAPE